jgi:hypothetical protein
MSIMTLKSPCMVAVYLTVPTQFVHRFTIIEWANMRRKMSLGTGIQCLMLLCKWGLVERKSGGYYRQRVTPANAGKRES